MRKLRKMSKLEIAKLPAFEPIQCIKDEQKFLKPESSKQMWQNIYMLMNFYSRGGCLSKTLTQKIIRSSIQVLKNQPNIIYLTDPITIVGDIHGQLFDLLQHLHAMNLYSLVMFNKTPLKRKKVLFLGDYVDRGNFSVQVMLLLLVLKTYQPKTFYLLRGNHQCKEVTQIYNFRRQCQSKYSNQSVYEMFLDVFCMMPLAAVVNGTFFCVHGGLSGDLRYAEDVDNVKRCQEIPRKGLFCDLMWSDPTTDSEGKIWGNEESEFNDNRRTSIRFGKLMLQRFLKENSMMCVIRAHQVQQQGYGFINWQTQSTFPQIMTLFSAPNYCGGFNKGAIASIEKNQINVYPLQKRPEPFVLPNFINVFELSFPFMIAYITQFFFYLLTPENGNEEESTDKSSPNSFGYVMEKELRSPIKLKKEKKKTESEESVEEKILKRQQTLLEIYSFAKTYINNNISFRSKLQESTSIRNNMRNRFRNL